MVNNNNKLTIALDVDGVLFDCHAYVHRIAESVAKRDLPILPHFDFKQSFDLTDAEWKRTKTIVENGYPTDDMDWLPGAVEFVNELRSKYDVFFLTSHWRGCNSWVPGRERRLVAEFKNLEVVFAHSKARGDFDILLDDKIENVEAANSKSFAVGVVFDQPWNSSATHLVRVKSYAEFLKFAQECEHDEGSS